MKFTVMRNEKGEVKGSMLIHDDGTVEVHRQMPDGTIEKEIILPEKSKNI